MKGQAAVGACHHPRPLVFVALLLLLGALVACGESPQKANFWQLALGDVEVGRAKIEAYGCASCHTIPGIPGADALVGPPLTGWSDREFISGQLPNEPDNLVAWLMDPPAIDENTAMPNLGIDEQDARDIAAYLYTLGEGLPATGDPLSAQPVAFSHQQHAGDLGLDCRYCHTSVADSSFAGLPSTRICMTCHSQVFTDVPILAPVRLSYEYDAPLPWVRVNDLHDTVHFDHAIHVSAGVGCDSCHGRVDEMRVVEPAFTITMSWCLECHRHPESRLRPPEEVFNMNWTPPPDQEQRGAARLQELGVSREILVDCSLCHY
jgi:mono/diheme cytochrome c family protein